MIQDDNEPRGSQSASDDQTEFGHRATLQRWSDAPNGELGIISHQLPRKSPQGQLQRRSLRAINDPARTLITLRRVDERLQDSGLPNASGPKKNHGDAALDKLSERLYDLRSADNRAAEA
jgi:hypothetical protein